MRVDPQIAIRELLSNPRVDSMRMVALALLFPVYAAAQSASSGLNLPNPKDPRVGLRGGWKDAASVSHNMELVAHRDPPEGFFNPAGPDPKFMNSDLAFDGKYVIQGNYNGPLFWDISNPAKPTLRASWVCPGGQDDVSIYGKLLFTSQEETRVRLDCGAQGIADTVSMERFRGVRIWDISDLDHPKLLASVQTCRGSHTHTLVTDPKDSANVYIYVSETAIVLSPSEMAGCLAKQDDPNSSFYKIDVIKVPLAAPQNARIVNSPRLFADSGGNIAGLWKGGDHGQSTQVTRATVQCHDITTYTEIGLAAGACAGNGLLLDIRDPANPRRAADVLDLNFNYFHSATFSNDGTKVLYTDEWGGGQQPRCRATDRMEWGADAVYNIVNGQLVHASYFKIPAPQLDIENCVAHNGSLVPVPGRDIFVQAWYQGGTSVIDFTDPAHIVEIAYFDRGPVDTTKLVTAGHWSSYWYNGYIFASEIGRGLDVFQLKPSEYLSQNELDAARLVHYDRLNVQDQRKIVWPASFVVARAYLDGLVRNDALRRAWAAPVYAELARAEKLKGQQQRAALVELAAQLERDTQGTPEAMRVRALAANVRELGAAR